jgi:hypothetical protein
MGDNVQMGVNKDGSRTTGKGGSFTSTPNIFGTQRNASAPALADDSSSSLALDRVLAAGHAVMLGHTRDGGALCITILAGSERHRTYCSNDEQLSAALVAMRELVSD